MKTFQVGLVTAACMVLGGAALMKQCGVAAAPPVASLDAGVAAVPDGGHGPVDFIAGAKEGQVARLEADDSCFIIHRNNEHTFNDALFGADPSITILKKDVYKKDSAECLALRAATDSLQTLNGRLERCAKEKADLYKQCVTELDKARKEGGKK